MLFGIELLERQKEYRDFYKWFELKSRVKNLINDLKNKKARKLAYKIYDNLEELCTILEEDKDKHDEEFERRVEEEYGND